METDKVTPTELADLRKRAAALEAEKAGVANDHSERRFASNGRVARTIAHEIRNPLTNINLAVEQLMSELPADESSRFLLEMINRNSKRINQIISDLLDSTKFAELKLSPASLNKLVSDVVGSLAERMTLKNVTLAMNFGADVKDIMVDEAQLTKALLNLLENSMEAMENTPDAILTVTTAQRGGEATVTIADNGKGMNEEDAKRVFEPYFTKKQSGLGLNLTLTQNIILNHKGKITVSTKLGQGTRFEICLQSIG